MLCVVDHLQGTMSHMAPEALLHGHISKAADMYSFGITLWELFTGGQPYQGRTSCCWAVECSRGIAQLHLGWQWGSVVSRKADYCQPIVDLAWPPGCLWTDAAGHTWVPPLHMLLQLVSVLM